MNAFSSISLHPALILVPVSRRAKAAGYLGPSGFRVNVLSSSQVDIAMMFAGRPSDATIHWVDGEHAPYLPESQAWLECTPWREYEGRDHILFLGEVQDASFENSKPLLFYSGDFHSRGEELDEKRRSRRSPIREMTPLHETAIRRLVEGFMMDSL